MKKSPLLAILIGFALFFLSGFLAKGLLGMASNEVIWLEQVLMKAILIAISLLAVRFLLKIPLSEAGFQKPSQKMSLKPMILGGMSLGALATVFTFFSPAQGIPMVKALNLLEFLLGSV